MLSLTAVTVEAQNDYEKYDQYDCIVEKILQECQEKRMWVSNPKENNWKSISNPGDSRNGIFRAALKQELIKREQDILNEEDPGVIEFQTDLILYCQNPEEEAKLQADSKNMLGYFIDHFIWEKHAIDCAWIRQSRDNIFKLIINNPSIFGGITLFSLGGVTLVFIILKKNIEKR